MARLPSLRRFDVQARFSFIASSAAVLPLLAGTLESFRRYDGRLHAIQYGESGVFEIVLMVCIGLSMMLSVIGLGLGFNSAGQRRNAQQRKSWAGFFLGTAVLSLSLILFYAFRALRFEIITG